MTASSFGVSARTNEQVSTNKRSRIGSIVHSCLVVVVVAVLLGIPFWLLIVTAGKTQAEAINPNMSLPSRWQLLQNFGTVLTEGKMIPAFLGSIVITGPSVFLALLLGSMASWILARRTTRPMAVVYALSISGLILPPAVVTVMMLLKMIGLSGTAPGMIGVYVGIYMSTVIFFVTGFVRTIPISLEEAARMDGAKPMRIFFTIVLPLLGPTLATATILVTLYIWNDVFYSLFILSGKMDLLPLNLYNVASAGLYLNNWHLIFAYIILMSLPLLLIFTFAQRRIISGITGGAVK
ncbi:carbohydrate ABC transporter permease [Bifidobacterium psychraerophilum]|uniref:carbohydrate ABC transporter permease n=1 Tax=Bifidobacterium psychraerophilum TaxID=218140 RepID=UPI0023F337C7|nr:carbohydrate ABC transporter permease [Bifidobacterium psychraerophilum]MCI1660598.1 carbohydrate ABC transporter permease [Bifidobacterium psychraerophilum]MCI1805468.1 carbohydrate ABC transporter permease [Bifidobacterium psychraerophilum]